MALCVNQHLSLATWIKVNRLHTTIKGHLISEQTCEDIDFCRNFGKSLSSQIHSEIKWPLVKYILYNESVILWPQWWSFEDMSQQGVDFSKNINKIKIIFWFDFHRCLHGPSKIRCHFRNKSRSILKLSKILFYKKCGPRLIFFNEIFF